MIGGIIMGLAILLYFVALVKSLVGARDPQLAAKPFAIRSARTITKKRSVALATLRGGSLGQSC